MAGQIEVRAIPAQHVAQLVAYSPRMGTEFVGPIVGPMFDQVPALLAAAGVHATGAPVGVYQATPDGGVRITVAFPVAHGVTEVPGLEVTTLPGMERAAVQVHRGGPETFGAAWTTYRERLAIDGYGTTSHTREIYASEPDVPPAQWETLLVVELHESPPDPPAA